MAGGARAHSGPPPDPNALRRERPSDQAGWTHLPAQHDLETPPWPLTGGSPREKRLWAEEWARPQAIMWQRNGWEREVALFCRAFAVAERPKGSTDSRRLVRQMMEGLGISGDGLRRHRWIIDHEAEVAPAREVSNVARASARERFKVVSDAG